MYIDRGAQALNFSLMTKQYKMGCTDLEKRWKKRDLVSTKYFTKKHYPPFTILQCLKIIPPGGISPQKLLSSWS